MSLAPKGLPALMNSVPGFDPGLIQDSPMEDEPTLLRAFQSFVRTAETLERSYGLLRSEVDRLRRELEASNAGLARSLEENRTIREHLDRILEGLPCGVLVVGQSGEISRINPEAQRLLGEDGIVLRSIAGLSGEVRQLLESARQRTNEAETELTVPLVSDPERCLAARHASIGSGDAAGASVFIVRDVSERKRFEKTRDTTQRQQALAEMSAVLAHEMRNPLGSLELFAGLLAEAELGGERQGWIEQVQAGLRTLAATVNNVLHFHSLPEPERSPVDLGQLLDWAKTFFAPVARQARVQLSLHNRLRGVLIEADRHRLEQVLLNLVLNAVRALPGGGWIELSGCRIEQGRTVSLVVADTGPGISQADLPHIFQPGFSTRVGSPGLGLAVCRKIVEQQGGSITASSRPGWGATFTITVPLNASEMREKQTGKCERKKRERA
jgi:two-component system, sensor histidine kinase FlrB